MSINIENSLLATFLDANNNYDDFRLIYKLDTSIFTSPFRKRVAELINEVKDNNYGFIDYTIEESVLGTPFEYDYLEIHSQTSLGLGFSKKYHDRLVEETKIKAIL